MGTGVTCPREGRRTVQVPLNGLLEKAAGAAAQLITRKTNVLRLAKATEDGRGGGGRSWSFRGSCGEWFFSTGHKLWRGGASRERDTGACGSDSLAAAAVAATCV